MANSIHLSEQNSNNGRIQYIDVLRGIAILLVIYSHSLVLMVSSTNLSDLNNIFLQFRMPLFFFISGFFIYRNDYSFSLLKKRTRNRIRKQLWPTFIFWILCSAIFTDWNLNNIKANIFDMYKMGYWFTIVSVEYFAIFAPIIFFFSRKKIDIKFRNIILVFSACFCISLYLLFYQSLTQISISKIFCIPLVLKYSPYLILGMLYRINIEMFNKTLVGLPMMFSMGILFLVIQFFPTINSPIFSLRGMIVLSEIAAGISAVLFVNAIFFRIYRYSYIKNKQGCITNILQYIGTCTLEIYLLHYFIVYSMRSTCVARQLESFINTPYEFPIYICISFIISIICIGVVALFKRARVYSLLFKLNLQ